MAQSSVAQRLGYLGDDSGGGGSSSSPPFSLDAPPGAPHVGVVAGAWVAVELTGLVDGDESGDSDGCDSSAGDASDAEASPAAAGAASADTGGEGGIAAQVGHAHGSSAAAPRGAARAAAGAGAHYASARRPRDPPPWRMMMRVAQVGPSSFTCVVRDAGATKAIRLGADMTASFGHGDTDSYTIVTASNFTHQMETITQAGVPSDMQSTWNSAFRAAWAEFGAGVPIPVGRLFAAEM